MGRARGTSAGGSRLTLILGSTRLPNLDGEDLDGHSEHCRRGPASPGPVGAYLPASFTAALDIGRQRDAARRLEQAGFGAAWVNEGIGGKGLVAPPGVVVGAAGPL